MPRFIGPAYRFEVTSVFMKPLLISYEIYISLARAPSRFFMVCGAILAATANGRYRGEMAPCWSIRNTRTGSIG